MMTSESTEQLFRALHEAQGKVEAAHKTGAAYEGKRGTRKYATLGDVQAACLPAMKECGLAYMVYVDGFETGKTVFDPRDVVWSQEQRAKVAVGEPCPIVIDTLCPVLCLRLMHVSGEWCVSRLVMPLIDNDPQKLGMALTYGHRYLLQNVMAIRTEDDDAQSATRSRRVQPEPIHERRMMPANEVMDLIMQSNDTGFLQDVVWLRHVKDRPEGEDRDRLKKALADRHKELTADAPAS